MYAIVGVGTLVAVVLTLLLQSIDNKPVEDDLEMSIRRTLREKEAEIARIERIICELEQD